LQARRRPTPGLFSLAEEISGRGPAWSGRVPRTHENAGSNPAVPTPWSSGAGVCRQSRRGGFNSYRALLRTRGVARLTRLPVKEETAGSTPVGSAGDEGKRSGVRFFPGSSNGRTAGSEPAGVGPTPAPGTEERMKEEVGRRKRNAQPFLFLLPLSSFILSAPGGEALALTKVLETPAAPSENQRLRRGCTSVACGTRPDRSIMTGRTGFSQALKLANGVAQP
jgi:hypothetical protein